MTTNNYEQAVAFEEENRLVAYLSYGRPVLGRVLAQLTWRHVIELSLAQNAFFTGSRATREDVIELLWRLDPWFLRPTGEMPNLPLGAHRPGRAAVAFRRFVLQARFRRCDLQSVEFALLEWLTAHWQDQACDADDAAGSKMVSSLAARLNWFDFIQAKIEIRDVLSLGVAVSFQILRAKDLLSGDPGLSGRYIPPSAALKRFDR